jgi:hypothetical protein
MLKSSKKLQLGSIWERMKKMGIQSRIGRIVGIIVENTMPWLAGGVFQHLPNYGKNHIYKDGRKNCCN